MKKLRNYDANTATDSFEKQLKRIDIIYQEVCLYRALKAKTDSLPYHPSYLLEALEEKKQRVQFLLDSEERLCE